MLKETGSLFWQINVPLGVLGVCSRRIAVDEEGVLYCPWPRTSTITLCSFLFTMVPVGQSDGKEFEHHHKEKKNKRKRKEHEKKTRIKVKMKACLPSKNYLALTRVTSLSRHFFPLWGTTVARLNKAKQNKTVQNPGIQTNLTWPSSLSPVCAITFHTTQRGGGGGGGEKSCPLSYVMGSPLCAQVSASRVVSVRERHTPPRLL